MYQHPSFSPNRASTLAGSNWSIAPVRIVTNAHALATAPENETFLIVGRHTDTVAFGGLTGVIVELPDTPDSRRSTRIPIWVDAPAPHDIAGNAEKDGVNAYATDYILVRKQQRALYASLGDLKPEVFCLIEA